jgi:pyruvate/2-oxoglutarate dehydrogenase complex dihydrolipoamide acyltransferase (E2) component
MKDIGGYRVEPIPRSRVLSIDMLEEGIKRHHVTALIEPDVTGARAALRRLESEGGRRLSFTAWLIKCIAQAASEQPEAHAVRRRKRLYIFDDVDVSLLIETELERKMVPLPYVVRKANEKSVEDISR